MISASLTSGCTAGCFIDAACGPRMFRPLINDFTSQFERDTVARETYVCSQLKLTDDRGTHAEKKGPLLYVDLVRSEEDRKGLGNSGQRASSRSSITASVPVYRELTTTYRSRTGEQTRMLL